MHRALFFLIIAFSFHISAMQRETDLTQGQSLWIHNGTSHAFSLSENSFLKENVATIHIRSKNSESPNNIDVTVTLKNGIQEAQCFFLAQDFEHTQLKFFADQCLIKISLKR